VTSHTPDSRIPHVVHRNRQRYDVYIGRGSKWGNPYKIGRDGDRAEVVALYERHIREERPDLLAALPELYGKALGCYCAPLRCHGDVLAKLVAEQLERGDG
jgi:Domain of unknown function (DUF4326)